MWRELCRTHAVMFRGVTASVSDRSGIQLTSLTSDLEID